MRMFRAVNAVALVGDIWKAFMSGTTATVKADALTLARKVKPQIVEYVISFCHFGQFRGSFGSSDCASAVRKWVSGVEGSLL